MRAAVLARLIRAYAQTWVRRPATPIRVVVSLTRRCNLRCNFCRTWRLRPDRELSPLEIARLLHALEDLVWLDLTGGEPFLRPDIESVFRVVLESSPSLAVLHFPTNGWFPQRVLECARLARTLRPDVDLLVTVSLDGPPDLHDRLRGRRGAYRRAVETWNRLRTLHGVEVRAGTTVGPDNFGALQALFEAMHRDMDGFEDRFWHLNLVQVSRHFFANEGIQGLTGPQAEHALRLGLRGRWPPASLVDLMEAAYQVHAIADARGESPGFQCHALHSGAFISSEAVLYPCHQWDRPLTDLRAAGFRVREVWGSREVLQAREEVARFACGGCFTPCEAYPTLMSSPFRAGWSTAWRLARETVAGQFLSQF